MQGIREYNRKIGSLRNTAKITKTMKMVAASKLRRAYKLQNDAKSYMENLTGLLGRLMATLDADFHHPLIHSEGEGKSLMLVISSDRGLCAGFNNNLFRYVNRWIHDHPQQSQNLEFSFCGKRGFNTFRKTVIVQKNYDDIHKQLSFSKAAGIADEVMTGYLDGKYQKVYIAYNVFHNTMVQRPAVVPFLPLTVGDLSNKKLSSSTMYIFEPTQTELLDRLLPQYLRFKLYYTLLEHTAGEHAARMTAMDSASRNSFELIKQYTLLRNRARQAVITKELIEIISGAEALK